MYPHYGGEMPQKDTRAENLIPATESGEEMKKIERFLRLLTWQMFFLLAVLLYLALRPQAGRYQFTVVGDDVGVFDTSNSQAWMIKLQKKSVTSSPGEKTESATPSVGGENK
jgi:hypothetical protein